MGPKKPAKRGDTTLASNILIGNVIKYIGLLGKRYVCDVCNRSFSRGFYYEHNNQNACSRRCLVSKTGE